MALFAPSLILHPGLQGHLFFFPLCLSLSLCVNQAYDLVASRIPAVPEYCLELCSRLGGTKAEIKARAGRAWTAGRGPRPELMALSQSLDLRQRLGPDLRSTSFFVRLLFLVLLVSALLVITLSWRPSSRKQPKMGASRTWHGCCRSRRTLH